MKTLSLPRSFYVPSNTPVVTTHPTGTNLEIHTYTSSQGAFGLVAFRGKQGKPFVNTYYRTEAVRDANVATLVQNALDEARHKADRKETLAVQDAEFIKTIKVGDIWSCSWGYDQTNVDFYVVVKVTGKMVHLREIGSRFVSADQVVPDATRFVSNALSRKIVHGGCSLESYKWAHPFEGGSAYQTPANAGH